MDIIDEIVIAQPSGIGARLQLLSGDLTAIPPEHKVDILVASAFPNDYTPLPGSLFYAFEQKGFPVKSLAREKELDLRASLSCWISRRLDPSEEERFNFKQLLCLEPVSTSTNPVEVVGNIFRCLNNFAFDEDHNSIAMPIVASGRQQVPVAEMLPALLDAAIFWLKQGVPLECIKVVLHTADHLDVARKLFRQQQALLAEDERSAPPAPAPGPAHVLKHPVGESGATRITAPAFKESTGAVPPPAEVAPPRPAADAPIDIFISYAHKQQAPVQHFVTALRNSRADLNIFYDRDSIRGGQWLRMISDAIARARKVVVFLSPDYSRSPVCWDEFQCAKVIEYNKGASLIQTIYLMQDDKLPPIMAINSYIDCRESDLDKLAAACAEVL